jgi:hypothetical protein
MYLKRCLHAIFTLLLKRLNPPSSIMGRFEAATLSTANKNAEPLYTRLSQTSQTMTDFQHEPLRESQSIRTLKLFPAKDPQEPLRRELKEILFQNGSKFRYEAVSYAWGAPSVDNFIVCHGKKLPITENCEAALKRLRKPSKTRTLWVDSICIDQASKAERSDQVKLMGSIYRRATRVLVWLGKGTEKSDWAMGYIATFGRYATSHLMGPWVTFNHYFTCSYTPF